MDVNGRIWTLMLMIIITIEYVEYVEDMDGPRRGGMA
jgi:hypothetical protein